MDAGRNVLIVGTSKGAPSNKVYSLHQLVDVVHISHQPTKFRIDATSGESLVLEMESKNATSMVVERLHAMITAVHEEYGNGGKMRPLKKV